MFQINNMPNPALRRNALTAFIWCAAAVGLVFWILKLPVNLESRLILTATSPIGSAGSASEAAAQTARAWGVQPAAPEVSIALSTRFQLQGVIASASGRGSALISVDGQPPKAFRVGQTLADGVTLISLSAKQANLGPASGGASVFSLVLPGQSKSP